MADSVALNGNNDDRKSKETVPCLTSQRWMMAYLMFLTSFWTYALRVNLSIAIVCMTRISTASNQDGTMFSNQSEIALHQNDTSFLYRQLIDINRTKFHEENKLVHPQTPNSEEQCGSLFAADNMQDEDKEFNWSKKLVAQLLSSYYYGAILTQFPGGYLAARFGGKRVLATAQLIAGIFTLLTPVCARTSPYLLLAVRVVVGLSGGCVFPAVIATWNCWAPPHERAKLTTGSVAGAIVAIVVTFSTSGVLCAYGFDNGWGSIFYLQGILSLLTLLLFLYVVYDTPAQHPRITAAEKHYIEGALKTAERSQQVFKTPWRAIATSKAVWALTITHVCHNWIYLTILFNLPLFMKEVLRFEIQQNGAFSALPYVSMTVGIVVSAVCVDTVIKRRILSVIATRRISQLASSVGAVVFLVAASFIHCEIRGASVALLCISSLFVGIGFGAFNVNHMDFCGIYAGVVYGITNCMGSLPGFLAPITVAALTTNGTRQEWQSVFYVTAGFGLTGALVFGTCSRGSPEPWALSNTRQTALEQHIPETFHFIDKDCVTNRNEGDTFSVHSNT